MYKITTILLFLSFLYLSFSDSYIPYSTKSSCSTNKYTAGIPSDNQGYFLTMANTWPLAPGDTIFISSVHQWTYLSGDGIHGTSACPITVINDGVNLVQMTAGIAFTNCTYMHITGTGGTPGRVYTTNIPGDTSHHTNGIYIFQYDSVIGPSRGNSLQVDGVTSFMHVDHIDEYARAYAFWLKNEASCADSLTFAPWKGLYSRIHDIEIDHIHGRNYNQDGFYLGSTSPDGQRHITCGGIDSTPIPSRLYNIHIHDCYLDSVGRTGLQLSGADSGFNEIDHDTLTRTGFEFNPTQGGGIILGGYSQGYVHDCYVRYTYQHGINNLGSGLVRVENNNIDSSGWLAGSSNLGFSNIAGTTLQTTNHGWTPAGINTTYLIKNNKCGVGTNNTGSPQINIAYGVGTWNTNNVVCGNVLQNGTPVTGITIQSPIVYSSVCTMSGNQFIFQTPFIGKVKVQ